MTCNVASVCFSCMPGTYNLVCGSNSFHESTPHALVYMHEIKLHACLILTHCSPCSGVEEYIDLSISTVPFDDT